MRFRTLSWNRAIVLSLMGCFVGCSALVTTNPLVQHGGDCVKDGLYSLVLDDFKETIPLTVAYDRTNVSYVVDAGPKYGTFHAMCCREKTGQLLLSITLSRQAQRKAFDSLTELEGAFLSIVHANARLIGNEESYDVWVLQSSRDISDGCSLTALPPEKLLPMLPSTNAAPFVCVGKLLRKEIAEGSSRAKCESQK